MDDRKALELRESFLAGDLSPRSPGIGSTPSRPDNLTTMQRRDRSWARDQARKEAGLGRTDAGTRGDVDAPDAPVGEGARDDTVLGEAMALREEIVAGARAADAAGQPWPVEVLAGKLVEVDQWIEAAQGKRTARAARGGARDTTDGRPELHEALDGFPDLPEILEDMREDAPPDRRRDRASGNAFVEFLRTSGDDVHDSETARAWLAEGME